MKLFLITLFPSLSKGKLSFSDDTFFSEATTASFTNVLTISSSAPSDKPLVLTI